MRKQFKTYLNLFVIFFILFYPIKSSASTIRCDLFIDTLLSLESGGYEYLPKYIIKDFGFTFKKIYDPKKKEWIKEKDKNGNFLVGKINNLDLAKYLKSENSIIKLNGKKFIADEKQNKTYSENDKIKFEFFDHEKGNFISDLERKTANITDISLDIADISINEIDMKKGLYEMRIVYDLSFIFDKEYHKKLWDVIDGTMVFKLDDGWNYTTCTLTEEEFEKSTLPDPGEAIIFLNIAKKDKDLMDIYYKLTPYSEKVGNNRNSLYLEKKIEEKINIIKPNIIFTHWNNDLNIDHKIINHAVRVATRPINKDFIKEILSFEVLSSTEWNCTEAFNPNYFVNISNFINIKCKSFNMYTNEVRAGLHPRNSEHIKALAKYRGGQAGYKFAESFSLIKKFAK